MILTRFNYLYLRVRKRESCLQQAKTNVETLYLSVGVSENIPAFLLVMETLLPQFFHGGMKKYIHLCKSYYVIVNVL